MVGVFDLGTRAFEGIRNASRMDEDDHDDADGNIADQSGGSGGGMGRNSDLQRRRSSSSLEAQQQQQQQWSPRPLGAIQEGSAWDSSVAAPATGVGGAVGGRGAAGLLSLRARPPRMFGPLGEMDPFTWETAVAQAVLRAGMRDEGDFPSER